MEWSLRVEPWSEILGTTENSILLMKFVSWGMCTITKCVTIALIVRVMDK